MRVLAAVALSAMTPLLGAWTLSDNGVASNWRPEGKAVVKTPDGCRTSSAAVLAASGEADVSGCGLAAGRLDAHAVPAARREGAQGKSRRPRHRRRLPPKWPDLVPVGTAHRQISLRRGSFVLFGDRDDVATGKPRFTGSWKCG
jgi:hypothetical protein